MKERSIREMGIGQELRLACQKSIKAHEDECVDRGERTNRDQVLYQLQGRCNLIRHARHERTYAAPNIAENPVRKGIVPGSEWDAENCGDMKEISR